MNNSYTHLFILISLSLLLISNSSHSECERNRNIFFSEDNTTPLNFGEISYADHHSQPVGSILSQTSAKATHPGMSADTVLWTCNKSDLPNIYFLVATSGSNTFGGRDALGDDIYATWFRYIGLKQTMAGVTLSRYWQKVPISKNNYIISNDKIKIRLMDIPSLEAKLIKVDKLPFTKKVAEYCNNNMAIAGTYANATIYGGGAGKCMTASARIQLGGNNNVVFKNFKGDQPGGDSKSNNLFYMASNGIAYGLGTSNTKLIQKYTCFVRTKTPLIKIPAITATDLHHHAVSTTDFNLELECNDNFQSGIQPGQIAIGFLPSINSQTQAKNLNLLTGNGTSEFLISENYHHANTAKGVGLTIQSSSSQTNLHFLAPNAPIGGGNATGWHPIVESNTININTGNPGYNIYSKQYRAVLQKLPNQTPTPGQFKATATIMVKIQ